MMKETEARFAVEVLAARNLFQQPPTRQEHFYLEKWAGKDWWDYGVSLRGGWLTTEGLAGLCSALNEVNWQGPIKVLRECGKAYTRLAP